MQVPDTNRRPLDGEAFHVVVIGGGVNGVAIARECARRGKRTLLVEQYDFGSGTTSRSTRIIHGGLRYLEHGELGLVREAARERQHLLREKPHLVRPLEFLLALDQNSRRSALAVRVGLWMYRHIGGPGIGMKPSREQQKKLERLLDCGRRWSLFSFEDAQCEFPELLVAEWLVEAIEAGAEARNYAEVLSVEIADGRAKGVRLRDRLTGREERVSATWIVNAAGPWADRVCQQSQIHTSQPMIGGVRGAHIVLPRFAGAPEAAVYTEGIDGRPVFVIPWNGQILVGTTEVPDNGDPARVAASAAELEYLMRSVQRLFPTARLSDILYSFAGVRPLPFSQSDNLSAVSRRHFLHDHASDGAANLISIVGGKLSTAGSLARECAGKIGVAPSAEIATTVISGTTLESMTEQSVARVAEHSGMSAACARAVVEWHGGRAALIARLARNNPEMSARLCPHTDHIVAEAVDAFRNECAVTLADVLLRRVPVALGPCWSESCSREAGSGIAASLGWDDRRLGWELENLEKEWSAFLRKPGSDVLTGSAASR